MAKYSVTYKCGHTGTVELFGKTSDREWRLEQLAKGNCPDCEEAELRKVIVDFNAERDLPSLSGTDRQVAWADKLRMYAIRMIEDGYGQMADSSPDKEPMSQVLQEMYSITDARFWIDHRDAGKYVIVSTVAKRIKNKEGKKPADPDPEYIATPKDRRHEGLVKIRINGKVVSFLYPKDNDFIEIMHRYFCRWRDAWTKKSSDLVGTPEDIAADIGNTLLREGFAVSFPTDEIKEKAVNADFEPVHTRWVVPYDSTDKKVAFEWEGRNEDLYYAVRGMKGCLYKNGTLHISVDRYNDIEDCARKNGFYIIPEAQALLDQARAKIEKAVVVPKEPEKPADDTVCSEDPLAELTEED